MRCVLIVLLFTLTNMANATLVDSMITINQLSTSGKTIFIDKGSHHEIVFDDYGILLKSFSKSGRSVFKPVAKMKAVKVYGETSIWVIFKTFIPQEIKKQNRLLLLSESSLLEGRTHLKISRGKIVGHANAINRQVKDTLQEDTKGLSKKEDDYHVSRKLHEKDKHYDEDVHLLDLDLWEDRAGDGNYRPVAFYQSPHAKMFSQRKRVETFEKMVVAFVRKYKDPKFTLQDLYYKQRKNKNIDLFAEKTATGSYFDRYIENEQKRKDKEDKIFADLQSKGESWSDGYSDEQLSELVYNIGAIQERERRREMAANKFDHQFYGQFGLNLINNENIKDRNNTQQSKYDLEISWEYYFLKKVELLERFSMEVSARRSQDAFTIGDGYNVTSVEYSAALQVNWYPFVKANILERNILYFGILVRTGLSRLRLSDTQEEGNYQISSLPGFRMGIKYNFNNSYGARLMAGYENINVSRVIRTYDGGLLPDRANYIEGKLSFGISKFF